MNAGNAGRREKFTPGEWKIRVISGLKTITNGKQRIADIIPIYDPNSKINPRNETGEADANAVLMKVAPKMYDMLMSVLDECHACGDTEPVDCPLKMQIEAVLKEARGDEEPDLCAELKNCADALEEIIDGVIGGDLPDTIIACAQDDLDRARAALKKAQIMERR